MSGWAIRALRDRLGVGRSGAADIETGLGAAAGWLARAQDATPDDGVSAYYDLKKRRWAGSYPETTGYIIPTLYRYADLTGQQEYRERATRMADWECDIQLPDGSVRAGTMDAEKAVPTVFNTGQVLFGWAAAFERTGNGQFLAALRRAADWLVAAQDEDGAWRRFGSPFASHAVNTYNTRTAFGLARAWQVLKDDRYLQAARNNIHWAIARAQGNGWLPDNDLQDNGHPLTHTIAYAIRGILEVGMIAGESAFVTAAERTAKAVASSQRRDGALPGRLDRHWRGSVHWSCLTGNAQMAVIWQRLDRVIGSSTLREAAQRANHFILSVQKVRGRDRNVSGGIAGSFPFGGGYMSYRYPNWAAKFLMDALMLQTET